jgi:hypothetical protein
MLGPAIKVVLLAILALAILVGVAIAIRHEMKRRRAGKDFGSA